MPDLMLDDIDFLNYERDTDARTNVKPVDSWTDEIMKKLRDPNPQRLVHLPWEKVRDQFHFRPGEVTLWAGQNGHGKTDVVTNVVLSLMGQDEKVCVASFEMKPRVTIEWMVRMFTGTDVNDPSYKNPEGLDIIEELTTDFKEWAKGRLWLYDQHGTTDSRYVLGMAKYCANELGVTHVVVDNLAKCVPKEDDYNGQKMMVDQLTAIARDYNIHIHLVHHLKKPANENAMPDKHDSKGSGAITDFVDNVMLVWRNKAKEEDVKSNGKQAKTFKDPDAMIFCRKQRHGEEEPSIKLWFDRASKQFVGNQGDPMLFFPNFPHRPSL